MNKPIAVLISDIHYNIHTLPLADAALRQAVSKANELSLGLIVAGDLHDTKANMRSECVTAIIETFKLANQKPAVLIGNHDRDNEKTRGHGALHFLQPYAELIARWAIWTETGIELVAYHHDVNELKNYLKELKKGSTIIMHQGLQGSDSGDYFVDKSALTHEDVKDFRVISGHYHRRQDIKTGRPQKGGVGLFSYIGNPFTLGFGEANHPEKGFQILMDDGTLEFVPTNLRKHVIYNITDSLSVANSSGAISLWSPTHTIEDAIWVKIKGTKSYLKTIKKENIGNDLGIVQDFKLDLIPTDKETTYAQKGNEVTQNQVLDGIIDSKDATEQEKAQLKDLWKSLK